ncbi:hypothetical protein AAF712_014981 [Marasmius tenuissimus]|uniref:Uncharacterized protein n=1 Tax=Marasmius tenuissimus TaxID=585030 RepID=A0ABR2ZD00_9AGAR
MPTSGWLRTTSLVVTVLPVIFARVFSHPDSDHDHELWERRLGCLVAYTQLAASLQGNPLVLLLFTMASYFVQEVLAQAPVNDIISWPPGLLLLASVLYAALGTTSGRLFEIEPVIGIFMFSGLPLVSLSRMRRVNWLAKACHFVPGIRTAHGKYNFWIRADDITPTGLKSALEKVTNVLHCVVWEERSSDELPILDESLWVRADVGMIRPKMWPPIGNPSAAAKPADTTIAPRDFLLWAAIEYHAFHQWEVEIYARDSLVYSTKGSPPSTVVDVESEEDAISVVAAQMVRRPHSQTTLRAKLARPEIDGEPRVLNLDQIDLNAPVCYIDFHSYAPESAKVSASLNELAHSYFVSLWIAILGGGLLKQGRVTFQNLAGRWPFSGTPQGCKGTLDEAYLSRLDAVLDVLQPYANTPRFFDLVFSGGRWYHRWSLDECRIGKHVILGKLVDWHSVWFGKTADNSEPGFKMEGDLRQGFLLNMVGLAAAICGAIFAIPTRDALGFGPVDPSATWVSYTSIGLCIGTSVLVAFTVILQQLHEKTWSDDSETPTRWMVLATVPTSLVVAGLALFFQIKQLYSFWPILDALTWISGLPLGMLENGRMISVDENVLHLVLLNRWMMGAVASAIGSNARI